MTKLVNIFWNKEQHRLRLIPRLILFTLIYFLLFLAVSPLFQWSKIGILLNNRIFIGVMEAGLTLLAVYLAGKLFDRRSYADFGFHLNRRWLKELGFGLGLGALLMAFIFILEWALGWITITEFFGTNTYLSSIPTRGFFWQQFTQAFFFYLLAAFSEELLFRVYPIKNMGESFHNRKISRKQALWLAAILASALFGVAHLGNPHASWISTVNIFFAGIMLSLGFIYSGEAALSIGLHFTWNFVQGVIFGFPISGTISQANLIRIEQNGPDLLTGGLFGPEAGLVGLLAMSVGSLAIIFYLQSQHSDQAA